MYDFVLALLIHVLGVMNLERVLDDRAKDRKVKFDYPNP